MMSHEKLGMGAQAVVILNDWICDISTWDPARPYLDVNGCSWIFGNLRGYGGSMGRGGAFTVEEAAADVIALADSLSLGRFVIVGHSMSCLVALHLAQQHPERIERAVLLTPPPPRGFGATAATLAFLHSLAHGDDARRVAGLSAMWGERLSKGWVEFKAKRWRACADPEAIAGYALMFARDGMPNPTTRITVPVLAVTGEQDAEVMRREAVHAALTPLCDQLSITALAECGHYPMQEAPPLLVTIIERFVSRA